MNRTVHAVVPAIDDPDRPSGGNHYDRRLLDELRRFGWTVRESQLAGDWPHPAPPAIASLAAALQDPSGDAVLLDGLLAAPAADLVVQAASHRPVVVVVHLPMALVEPGLGAVERDLLGQVAAVVATSEWGRHQLLEHYRLAPGQVHVATPGTDPAEVSVPSPDSDRFLCVGAVTRAKGYDVLLAALALLGDRDWRCRCAGSLAVDTGLAEQLMAASRGPVLAGRLRLTGPLSRAALAAAYASTDLLVVPSRLETYGMVVTEALARGIPVIATDVGGVRESLGSAPDGSLPGALLPAGDAPALAAALCRWLDDGRYRDRLRTAARARRGQLTGWSATAATVADVLSATVGQDGGRRRSTQTWHGGRQASPTASR